MFCFIILPIVSPAAQADYLALYSFITITTGLSLACTYSSAYQRHAKLYALLQASIIAFGVLLTMIAFPNLANIILPAAGLPIVGLFFILGVTWFQALYLSLVFFCSTLFVIFHLAIPLENYAFPVFTLFGFTLIAAVGSNRTEIMNRLSYVANIENTRLIHELQTKEKKLHTLSITDGLTQLFNRRHFDNIGPIKLQDAQRLNSSLHLLMLDIDHFKLYNDHYGHPAGDEILKTFSVALNSILKRSTDMAFRIGGEEFAIIMLSNSPDDAKQLPDIIHNRIKGLNLLHEKSPTSALITVSIGVASASRESNQRFKELYLNADKALYLAKQSGRNKTHFY
ncbi:MAG: diguanylate cyclase [Cycloclasticus sp.]